MVPPVVVVGSFLGLPLVDSVAGLFLAVVAPAVLGVLVAVALVVVDPVVLVHSLAPLGLVVAALLLVLVVLALVVDPVDLLDPVVAHRPEARAPVAPREETVKRRRA
jgi:hypothetical protein